MKIPFTQTKEYLNWHKGVGTKTFYKEFFVEEKIDTAEDRDFQIDSESEFVEEKKLLAICASLVINLRIGKVLYVPYGPVIFDENGEDLRKEIIKYLTNLAKKEGCFFVRMENISENKKTNEDDFEDRKKAAEKFAGSSQATSSGQKNHLHLFKLYKPKKKVFAKEGIFQPRMEWWLDLREGEEELFNRIHKDHRYSIRRAEKENIKIEIVTEDLEKYFESFWKLLKETGERDGFILHDEKYYKEIFNPKAINLEKFLVFSKLNTPPNLPFAVEEDSPYLSVALVVISDKIANLVFAGSVSQKRELGFNHLMQWEAIKMSKSLSCEIYNFGGITEDGYGKQSLEGVTKFKKKFGGFMKFHGGFVDIPIKKLRYFLYILRKMF